jgi:hypothetical protein
MLRWLAAFAPYYPYVLLVIGGVKWLGTTSDDSLVWRLILKIGGSFVLLLSLILLPVVAAVDVSALFGFSAFRMTHATLSNTLSLNACAMCLSLLVWLMLAHPEQWWSQPKKDPDAYDLHAARAEMDRLLRDAYAAGVKAGQNGSPEHG